MRSTVSDAPARGAGTGAVRVLTVYGTRPEAIKLAPVLSRLAREAHFESIAVVTGQHREMLDQVNQLFGIEPDFDLNLMRHGATLAEISADALAAIDGVLEQVRPDVVLVQGDTTSAFIAALAAFYRGIKVAHLEAGLRTNNLNSPFPEEANRQLTSRLAAINLAPTAAAKANLLAEGVSPSSIAITGNTVIDALYAAIDRPVFFSDGRISEVIAGTARFVLVTTHRRESWGEPMRAAVEGIRQAAVAHPDVQWIVPMHRNQIVRDVLVDGLAGLESMVLCEPLDYHEFCHVMNRAHLIVSDSGGVQEEAPALGKPVLVLRDNTERPEAIAAGTSLLVGTNTERVYGTVSQLLDDPALWSQMATAINPYGDGLAAARCVATIAAEFGVGERPVDFVPARMTSRAR